MTTPHKEERLRRLRRSPETCLRIGMQVLEALRSGDRAETHLLERGVVRTFSVERKEAMEVKE